ncbi:MAG: hypothetical protein ACLFV7_04895 [Phycisphaerae bacterium]
MTEVQQDRGRRGGLGFVLAVVALVLGVAGMAVSAMSFIMRGPVIVGGPLAVISLIVATVSLVMGAKGRRNAAKTALVVSLLAICICFFAVVVEWRRTTDEAAQRWEKAKESEGVSPDDL